MEEEVLDQIFSEMFNLDQNETLIYKNLILRGNSSAGQLSSITEMKLDHINIILDRLLEKNLIQARGGKVKIYRAFAPYKGFLKHVKKISENFRKLDDEIKKISQQFSKKLDNDIKKNKKFLEILFKEQSEKVSEVEDTSVKIKEEISPEITRIKSDFEEFNSRIEYIFTEYLTNFEDKTLDVKKLISKLISDFYENFKILRRSNKEFIDKNIEKNLKPQKDLIRNFQAKFSDISEHSQTIFVDHCSGLKNQITIILDNFEESFQNVSGQNKEIIIKKLNSHVVELEFILNGVFEGISSFIPNSINLLNESLEKIDTESERNSQIIQESSVKLLNKLRENEFRWIRGLSKNLSENVNKKMDQVIGVLKSSQDDLISHSENFTTGFNKLINNFESIHSNMINGLKGKIEERMTNFSNILNDIINKLNEKITENIFDNSELDEKIFTDLETEIVETMKVKFEFLSQEIFNFSTNLTTDFEERTQTFSDNIIKLKDIFFEKINQTSSSLEKDAQSLKTTLNSRINSQIDIIQKEGLLLETQLKDKILKELEKMNSDINAIKLDTSNYLNESVNLIETEAISFKEIINNFISTRIVNLEKNLTISNDDIKKTINDYLKNIQDMMMKIEKSLIESSNKQFLSIKENIQSLEKKFESTINSRVNESKIKINTLKDNFLNTIEKKFKKLEEMKKFESKVTADLEKHVNLLREHANEITENVTNMLEKHATDFGMKAETIKSSFNDLTTKEISNSEQLFSNIVTNLKTILTENSTSLKIKTDEIGTNVENLLKNNLNIRKRKDKKAQRELSDIIRDFSIDWNKNLDEINNYSDSLNENIENFEREANKFQFIISEDLSTVIDPLKDSIAQIESDLNVLKGELENEYGINLDNLDRGRKESINRFANDLKAQTDKSEESFKDLILKQVEVANNKLQEMESTLQDKISKFTNDLKTSTDQINDKLGKNLVDLGTKVLPGSINKIKTRVEDLVDKDNLEIQQKFDELQDNIKENNQVYADVYNSFTINLKKGIEEMQEQVLDDYESKINMIQDNIIQYLDSNLKDHKMDAIEVQNEISNNSTSNMEKLNENIDDLIKDLSGQLIENKEEYARLMNNVKGKIEEFLTEIKTENEETFSTIGKEGLKEVEDFNRESGEIENLLNSIWDQLGKLEFAETDKTWKIVSNEAILSYLNGLIDRTKTSLTIVIPELNQIDLGKILELKSNIRVHIFTDVGLSIENDLINEILEKRNVRIWQVQEVSPYYGFLRDSEEVLLAPDSENRKNIVGLVSEQQENIELFKNVIGPKSYSISTELKKGKKVEELSAA